MVDERSRGEARSPHRAPRRSDSGLPPETTRHSISRNRRARKLLELPVQAPHMVDERSRGEERSTLERSTCSFAGRLGHVAHRPANSLTYAIVAYHTLQCID